MLSIITDATCGEGCWAAKEDICKCSCGGHNHGILLTPEGMQPNRTCKIDGFRYKLIEIGKYSELYAKGERTNKDMGTTRTIGKYTYYNHVTDVGALVRVKAASMIQIQNWKELGQYKAMSRTEL